MGNGFMKKAICSVPFGHPLCRLVVIVQEAQVL